jgi:Cu/Ag efflux protein CusF
MFSDFQMEDAMHRWFLFLSLMFILGIAGCSTSSGGSKDKDKLYDVTGKVLAVQADPKEPKVRLDHEAIPGVMDAMKMWFYIEDAKLLDGIKEGDQVKGRFKMPDGKSVITELKKL